MGNKIDCKEHAKIHGIPYGKERLEENKTDWVVVFIVLSWIITIGALMTTGLYLLLK